MSTDKQRRVARRRRISTVFVLLAALSAGASGIASLFLDPSYNNVKGPSTVIGRTDEGPEEDLVLSLLREVRLLQERVDGLTDVPDDAPVAAHIDRLDQTLSGMTERVASLEDAILTDPAKAVQVPLLSDQVADLAARTDAALAAQRDDVDRVYDFLKFSIGGLAVGILSMAITTVFRSRHEPPS